MPVENTPLPTIRVQNETEQLALSDDIVTQISEATYSPSPLNRILRDPTILPPETTDYTKTQRDQSRRRPSRSPRRELRSEVVAAIAIAEEEKQSRQLKSILRSTGERLEYEIRRADAAILRAEVSERQEKVSVTRTEAAEAEKEDMRKSLSNMERELRNYQIQLEASQRDVRRLQADLEATKREMEELHDSEGRAQTAVKKYQHSLRELQLQMGRRDLEVQSMVDEWYNSGRQDGYDEGYDEGYEAGRKAGLKEGVRKGRKEGFKEGVEKGEHEERRNAMEAFDRFLMEDEQKVTRTRRWAQSIYNPDVSLDTLYPIDSGSVL